MSVLIPFAKYQNRWVTVDEVQRGDCGGVCVDCGGKLVARKGSHKVHHFSHKATDNCGSTGETALHQFAKAYLADPQRSGKRFKLQDFHRPGHHGGVDLVISKGWAEYYIKKVKKRVDVLLRGEIVHPRKPPFYWYVAVEVCVTNRKISEDIEDYRNVPGLSVIEIDLSMDDLVSYWKSDPHRSPENIAAWLLMSGSSDKRRWLVPPGETDENDSTH